MTLLRLTPAIGTHVGMRRRHNEDSIGYRYPDALHVLQNSGALFVVADGVGGLSAGERASSMTVERLTKYYYDGDGSIPAEERLATAVRKTNNDVYKFLNDPGKPAATTLVAIVILKNQLIAVSVGDSQIFLIRNDEIRQLNEVDVLKDGSDEDGALTKAMGYRESIEIETISGILEPNDTLILCSDGLTRYLDNEQLIRLSRLRDPRDSVRRMINDANQKGGADNISVAIVHVGEAIEEQDIGKHVQKLVVPVSIDTQPMMTPNVDTKPNTNIPLSRPEPVVPDSFPIAENPIPKTDEQRRATGKYKPLPEPQNGRNVIIIAAIAVLVIGAIVFFGALFFLTRDDDADVTGTPEFIVTEAINPTEDLSTETLDNAIIAVGDVVTVESSIPTLVRVGETVGSFVTVPNTPYLIQEIFEDREGQLWYRLLDEESNQTGWIAARDVTPAQ
jgi:PPM family protein phosphatase